MDNVATVFTDDSAKNKFLAKIKAMDDSDTWLQRRADVLAADIHSRSSEYLLHHYNWSVERNHASKTFVFTLRCKTRASKHWAVRKERGKEFNSCTANATRNAKNCIKAGGQVHRELLLMLVRHADRV